MNLVSEGKMGETSRFDIEKFNHQKFELGKINMEYSLVEKYEFGHYVRKQSLGLIVKQWENMFRNTKYMIQLCFLNSKLLNVSKEVDA